MIPHSKMPVFALCVLFGLLPVTPVRAAAPFSFDTSPGRLPKDVVPEDYDIAIIPNTKDLSIAGTETVRLEFRKATDTIQFNSLNVKLAEVTLDGKPVKNVVSDD